jgi:hypothetical protein
MTRTAALLRKEWRDHRVTLAVFAALVPLVSWPVQRYVFKFTEPEWTWRWILPICVGLATAAVAADLFASDLATSRMDAFLALPVPLRHHFTARTAFLAAVALAFTVWTVAMNILLVAVWGKPGAAASLVAAAEFATEDVVRGAGAIAAVLVFSALGIGGFRAVIAGVVLAAVAYAATVFAADKLGLSPPEWSPVRHRELWILVPAAAVMSLAAWTAFFVSRGQPVRRKRGALWAAAVLVVAFGTPASGAAWKVYREWTISPDDENFHIMATHVSPDGRFVGVVGGNRASASRRCRSWIVPVDRGPPLAFPGHNDYIGGWTTDGLAWVGRYDTNWFDTATKPSDYGCLVRPETGEIVERLMETQTLGARLAEGWGVCPAWAQWLRIESNVARYGKKGVPFLYTYRLWTKDRDLERTTDACCAVAPTPKVGEVLIVTADQKLALLDLAGGEPRVVADDATGLAYWLTGSSDGRYDVVGTSKGPVVLDSTTWRRVAGPFPGHGVQWCGWAGARSLLAVFEEKTGALSYLLDVDKKREIRVDPSVQVVYAGCFIQPLADGRIVLTSAPKRVLLLDADGKLIRRLFPPEE